MAEVAPSKYFPPHWNAHSFRDDGCVHLELEAPISKAEFWSVLGHVKRWKGIWDAVEERPATPVYSGDADVLPIERHFYGKVILAADVADDLDLFTMLHTSLDTVARKSGASVLHTFIDA